MNYAARAPAPEVNRHVVRWDPTGQSPDLLLLGAKRVLVRRGIFLSGELRAPGRSLDPAESATLDGLIARLEAEAVTGFEASVPAAGVTR